MGNWSGRATCFSPLTRVRSRRPWTIPRRSRKAPKPSSRWRKSISDRNKGLIASHAIAQSDLDTTNDAFLEADAALKAAQAAVQTAQLNLNYTAITAPVSGRVSRAEITVGNLVGDGPTAPVLTTVVSVSPVYVEFEIDEQTYLKYLANGASGNSGLDHIPGRYGPG